MFNQEMFNKELEGIEAEITDCVNLNNPYWRMNLYPQTYTPQLLGLLEECKLLIQDITNNNYNRLIADREDSNWIAECSSVNLSEYWRFYQSGQFINFSEIINKTSSHKISESKSERKIVYPIMKNFKLAKQLCQSERYHSDIINISIELINIKGFILEVSDYPNRIDKVESDKVDENTFKKLWIIESGDLSHNSFDDKVIEAIIWFAKCFPWNDVTFPENILKEHYQDLLGSI